MFRTKDQKAYLKTQREALLEHFSAYCETGDMAALHHWRLGVKKTRALLSLPGWGGKKLRNSAALKAVDELYARSGRIRQHYLNQQRLAEVQADGDEQNSGTIAGQEPEALAAAAAQPASPLALSTGVEPIPDLGPRPAPRSLTRKPRKALRHMEQYVRLLREQCKPLPGRVIRELFRQRRRHIARLLERAETKDPEALHAARTAIKKLMYVHQALPEPLQDKLRLNLAYLDALQEAIGNWRDAGLAAKAAEKLSAAQKPEGVESSPMRVAHSAAPAASPPGTDREAETPARTPDLRTREVEALEHVRELAVHFEQHMRRPKAEKR